jgi:signal peptidase
MATATTSPDAAARRAGGALSRLRASWAALVVAAVARGVLTLVLGLLLWSVVPVLGGWESTVVMSGSMSPKLLSGDVVLVRPVGEESFRPGQVLLVDDPDHLGRLRLHRLVEIADDGTLVLKGDANPQVDSAEVAVEAAHGVAALRVPWIGRPSVWLDEHHYLPLASAGAAFVVTVLGAVLFRPDAPGVVGSGRAAPRRGRRWRMHAEAVT